MKNIRILIFCLLGIVSQASFAFHIVKAPGSTTNVFGEFPIRDILDADTLFIEGGTGDIYLTAGAIDDNPWYDWNIDGGSITTFQITFTYAHASVDMGNGAKGALIRCAKDGLGNVQYVYIIYRPSAQTEKTIHIETAGSLNTVLTPAERNTVTNLTITGNIDARDFKTMRDSMPLLAEIDMSGVTIAGYTGNQGTESAASITYPANTIPNYAFKNPSASVGKASLANVVLPTTITSVGRAAFLYCNGLSDVEIPSSVLTIGRSSFNGCKKLKGVTFQTNPQLTTIGYLSFAYCDSLVNFEIPSGVTIIDYGAFYLCDTLTNFNLPGSLQSIGSFAFYSCKKITDFNIPATTTSIGQGAFIGVRGMVTVDENNPNYSSLNGVLYDKAKTQLFYCPPTTTGDFAIPSTVKSIEVDAFYNCVGLTSITLPSQLEIINDWAFENCIGLNTISIPESVQTISSQAFYNCTNLDSIYSYSVLPVDLSMTNDVFYNVDMVNCVLSVPYGSLEVYQNAPQWQDFQHITELDGIFASEKSLYFASAGGVKKISLASTVGWTASSDQLWLTVTPTSGSGSDSVQFTVTSSSIDRTGTVTFCAEGYSDIIISVTQYGVVDVTAGNLSTVLGEQAASTRCLTLTGTIDARDFKTMRDEMPYLEEVDLSGISIVAYNGDEGTLREYSEYASNEVPEQAFMGGTQNLKIIVLPETVNSISFSAFDGCFSLKECMLPSALNNIGSHAFSSCYSLSNISIPGSVLNIGDWAFYSCSGPFSVDEENPNYMAEGGVLFNKYQTKLIQCPTSLSGSYNIPSSVDSIWYGAFSNSNILEITIPSSVVYIGSLSFYACKNLSTIQIPNSVTTIENSAFSSCSNLVYIHIPSSVTYIGSHAFAYNNLFTIFVYSPIPVDLSNEVGVFEEVSKTNCNLWVPYHSTSAYQNASQWQDFINISEMLPDSINVTFRVDMQNETVSENGVHLNGNFSDWNEPVVMSSSDGRIYTTTLRLKHGRTFEYKFINGGGFEWDKYEIPPSGCTFGPDHNRLITTGPNDTTLNLVCFNSCSACPPIETNHVEVAKTTVTPIIDGSIDPVWDEVQAIAISKNYIGENPTVDAYWKAVWADSGLFVLVNVQDDDHWPSWESYGNFYDYDWCEVYLDVNDTIVDGLGVGNYGTGHYQSFVLFDPDLYGQLIQRDPSSWETGGLCAYQLTGENYVREYFFPFTNFTNKRGVTLNKNKFLLMDEIGFDIVLDDQDEGITTSRQRKVWQSNELDSWINTDSCGTIRLVGELPLPDSVNVTFLVDMQKVGAVPGYVTLMGNFNNWSQGIDMAVTAESVCTATVKLQVGDTVQYKFIDSIFWESVPAGCAFEETGNRWFIVPDTDTTLPMVCFSSCEACETIGDTYEVTTSVPNHESTCFNALQTITVAGGGTTVDFESGSTVDLIAGQSIRFLPGFHSHNGSQMNAWITTDGTFCEGGPAPIVAQPESKSSYYDEEPESRVGTEKLVKVFPNPNNGTFSVELKNFENAIVSIYSISGAKLLQVAVNAPSMLPINLPNLINGIYFLKVNDSDKEYVTKFIVNGR